MKISRLLLATLLALAMFASAQGQDIDAVVKKLEAKFDATEAKPGQLVTLKIKIDLDADWHTYPTVQSDKAAASQVIRFKFPKDSAALFVGKTIDPPHAKSKVEKELGIENLLYYPGGGTFEQKVILSPKATAGEIEVKIPVQLIVCNEKNCLFEKMEVTAKIKILDGPAMEVDASRVAANQRRDIFRSHFLIARTVIG